jgi:Uma2 family endonuclease
MASSTLVSLGEYLETVYEPDCEYVEGELLERNMGETEHAGLQTALASWLFIRRQQWGLHVFAECRVLVAPGRYRIPDIAVTKQKARGSVLLEPPFLCIEILSPDDRASRLEDKIDDYFRFGVAHIWVIDPQRRSAWSYTREGKREAVAVLTTQDPLIEVTIGDFFQELEHDIETGA